MIKRNLENLDLMDSLVAGEYDPVGDLENGYFSADLDGTYFSADDYALSVTDADDYCDW